MFHQSIEVFLTRSTWQNASCIASSIWIVTINNKHLNSVTNKDGYKKSMIIQQGLITCHSLKQHIKILSTLLFFMRKWKVVRREILYFLEQINGFIFKMIHRRYQSQPQPNTKIVFIKYIVTNIKYNLCLFFHLLTA